MPSALILGRGMAGLTVGRRLALAGWRVSIAGNPLPPGRMVTLDPSVLELLDLEFGSGLINTVTSLTLKGRELCWQEGPDETVESELTVLDLSHLASTVQATLPETIKFVPGTSTERDGYDYVLEATGRGATSLLRSGNRTSHLWLVPDPKTADVAFLRASEQGGWIFATPTPGGRLFVQLTEPGLPSTRATEGAAASATNLLASSPFRDVVGNLKQTLPNVVDTTPTFCHPVPGANRLRVGDASAAGDPLAGDGVGKAVRGGVLAAATVLDCCRQQRASTAWEHYAGRIALAHATHLKSCASFYSTSRCAGSFVKQIEMMNYHGHLLEASASRVDRPLTLNAAPKAPVLKEMMAH